LAARVFDVVSVVLSADCFVFIALRKIVSMDFVSLMFGSGADNYACIFDGV